MKGSGQQFNKYNILLLVLLGLCLFSSFSCAKRVKIDPSPSPSPIYKPFFDSPEVNGFKKRYLDQGYTLSTPSVTFFCTNFDGGFASYVNNALNGFVAAHYESLPFHLVSTPTWGHVSWSHYFNDFSAKLASPIILRSDPTTNPSALNDFTLPYIPNPNITYPTCACNLTLLEHGHYTIVPMQTNWLALRNSASILERRPNMFQKKKTIAQVLWEPIDEIRQVVEAIKEHYITNKNVTFVTLHIRQGDKLLEEMKPIPLSAWKNEIVKIEERFVSDGKQMVVFMFSDDSRALSRFRVMIGRRPKTTFFTLEAAIKTLLSSDIPSSLHARLKEWKPYNKTGYDHSTFLGMPEEERIGRTKELIASLSLASYSSRAVCTYSSNICRLMALLLRRSGARKRIHSVDLPHWFASK